MTADLVVSRVGDSAMLFLTLQLSQSGGKKSQAFMQVLT
jgi:hypothetical protein